MEKGVYKTNVLFIVDAQNDFCNKKGSLANEKTVAVVDNITKMLNDVIFDKIVCTMDTHGVGYNETIEGRHLPIAHCLKPSWGWKMEEHVYNSLYYCNDVSFVEKSGFAPNPYDVHTVLGGFEYDGIYVCGVCTDICVLNTALMLKNFFDKEVYVVEPCCAGSEPENHYAAIRVMKACHINVVTDFPDGMKVVSKKIEDWIDKSSTTKNTDL